MISNLEILNQRDAKYDTNIEFFGKNSNSIEIRLMLCEMNVVKYVVSGIFFIFYSCAIHISKEKMFVKQMVD